MPTYRLSKLVSIWKADKPSSDFGYAGDSPQKVCSAWAQIEPLSASERVVSEQVTPGSTHRIVIRWPDKDIESGMSVRCNDFSYEVNGVLDLGGDGQYLELTCTRHRGTVGKDTTR